FLRARSEPAPRGGESGSGHDSGGGHDSQSGIGTPTRPNAIQVRALMEFDHAVRTLQLMADAEIRPDARIVLPKDAPRSIGEGIDLLHIRVHNLQRSFGMKPIKAIGRPFDPKLHEVRKTCSRLDLPDGQVAEELAPGFLLGTDVVRRAVVTVNRHRPSASPA
ncbi:MAG: nucleotide exchange factor GrpE, partial [Acidobacteriota bacterium]